MHTETSAIIEKWYKKLNFNSKYDAEFYDALNTIPIPASTSISTYPLDTMEGKKNLLSFLYMCEALAEVYAQKGIGEDILLDSLSDIVIWCNEWSEHKGELFLGETGWVARTMQFRIFRLGRLQFCIETVSEKFTKFGMRLGESFLSIHIPKGEPLDIDECKKSLAMAREFFAKYFPEIRYSYFSCNSWLLDETLQTLLPESSNILQFAKLFNKVDAQESYDIIRFVFGLGVTKENISEQPCHSGLAKKVQARVLANKPFYLTRGLIAR